MLFNVYCYVLTCRVSKPLRSTPADLADLQRAYKRMLQSGLASLPSGEESLLSERPGSPFENIEQLEFYDPRAVDFRNRMRTW